MTIIHYLVAIVLLYQPADLSQWMSMPDLSPIGSSQDHRMSRNEFRVTCQKNGHQEPLAYNSSSREHAYWLAEMIFQVQYESCLAPCWQKVVHECCNLHWIVSRSFHASSLVHIDWIDLDHPCPIPYWRMLHESHHMYCNSHRVVLQWHHSNFHIRFHLVSEAPSQHHDYCHQVLITKSIHLIAQDVSWSYLSPFVCQSIDPLNPVVLCTRRVYIHWYVLHYHPWYPSWALTW